MTRTYAVIFEPGSDNWAAYAPDVPGCVATGKTREECAETFREALEFHFEGLRLRGESIPVPASVAGAVVVSFS